MFMTIQELNTLHVCDFERTELLTIGAMSVQYPELAFSFLAGNSRNFRFVENSTVWLHGGLPFLSPLYEADKFSDRRPT